MKALKIVRGFVTNSSSTCFTIINKAPSMRTLRDFVLTLFPSAWEDYQEVRFTRDGRDLCEWTDWRDKFNEELLLEKYNDPLPPGENQVWLGNECRDIIPTILMMFLTGPRVVEGGDFTVRWNGPGY